MELSTREIALLIWLCIAASFCLIHPTVRPSTLRLVKASSQRQIVVVITLLYVYLGFVVWGLSLAALWDWGQLKNTFIWSIAVGIASLFRINEIEDEPHFFRKWILGHLKVIAAVEFIITFYTFPLLVELILFPLLFIVASAITIGEDQEKYRPAVSFLNGVLALFGLMLISYAVYMIVIDFQNFASVRTIKDFYTPIALSFAFVPFIFVLYVYSSYRRVFGVLGISIKDDRLRRYAKFRSALAFGLNVESLRRWQRNIGIHKPSNRDDVRKAIREVKNGRHRERKPNPVPAEQGWNPHVAKDFLVEHGLRVREYGRVFDEWFASSVPLKVEGKWAANILTYYVSGNELVAEQLALDLAISNPEISDESDQKFWEIANALTQKAVGKTIQLPAGDDSIIVEGCYRIAIEKTIWPNGLPGRFERKITITPVGLGDAQEPSGA